MAAARRGATSQTISAIIPCYNGARYIEEAVRSVLAQTRPVDEVIVVDDGSTDDSVAIVERLGVRCVRMPHRSGPAAARNRGVEEASGDLIAFLDADDRWCATHCERVAGLLERHPESAVAFSRVRHFGDGEESLTPIAIPEDETTPALWHLLYGNIVPQSTAIARRSTLVSHGGYDASLSRAEDYELWLRLARTQSFVCIHTVTADYRMHPDQATRDVEGMVQGHLRVKHRFWQEAVGTEPRDVVDRVERVLLAGWNAMLKSAWVHRNERVFRAALSLHELIPGSAASHRKWRSRYRRWWRSWLALSWTWARLPGAAKRIVRPRAKALFARQSAAGG
jgi:glycosyltransferase involved in cell wall biosynthesis